MQRSDICAAAARASRCCGSSFCLSPRNSYWPAFYFVDKAGRIRHVHFGEGDYDGSEAVIRELLAEPAPV